IFFDDDMHILPCRAMGSGVDITRVCLTSLPRMPIPSLLEGLKASLQHFGKVLDCGIYREVDSQFFMGEGFAILDHTTTDDIPSWLTLSHTITWCDTPDFFYATWKEMELHCARCHQ
ncbi:hypothetical protein K492DRAFT_102501, partial [Lichtheimia hyalospora FSU 10163]